jgi:imidazole glycerol phosphate synthase subunit HisF
LLRRHEYGDKDHALPLIRKIKAATSAAVVASGGAGKLEHFYIAVEAGATILLAASVFHINIISIEEKENNTKGCKRAALWAIGWQMNWGSARYGWARN